jgi:hypothetical protein
MTPRQGSAEHLAGSGINISHDKAVGASDRSPKILVPYSYPSLEDYTPGIYLPFSASLRGPGCTSAVTDQETFCEIVLNQTDPGIKYAYATFESEDTVFAVIARLSGPNTFRITFTPFLAGNYTLVIDLLTKLHFIPVLAGRDSFVPVKDFTTGASANKKKFSSSDSSDDGRLMNVLPSRRCSGLPSSGKWMRCSSKHISSPLECLRWGWTFRASDDGCYFDNWKYKDLEAYSSSDKTESKWIVFLGTSRIRGVFLSLLDHLVNGKQRMFLKIHQCWGRIDVTVGKIRITYQDFRGLTSLKWPLPGKQMDIVECHGELLANAASEFARNSTNFVKKLFESPNIPSAVAVDWSREADPRVYAELISIPLTWSGSLVFINFRSQMGYPLDNPSPLKEELSNWTEIFERPIDFIDTHDIIRPWVKYGEFGVRRASQHWHKVKAQLTEFGVEGIVTDQLGQMLLNQVLGPRCELQKDNLDENVIDKAETTLGGESVKVCIDCPTTPYPYHVNVVQDFECFDEIPQGEFVAQYNSSRRCPSWCFQRPVDHNITTQSGIVDGRFCSVALK